MLIPFSCQARVCLFSLRRVGLRSGVFCGVVFCGFLMLFIFWFCYSGCVPLLVVVCCFLCFWLLSSE